MASHAACGIHPPASWRRRFSADPLQAGWTRLSREGSARAHFRSSQSCVWVKHRHHCPWAGPWPWAEERAWVGVIGVIVGTAGGGWPWGFLVVLCRWGAHGVGARGDVDPRVCAHRLCLGVGLGLTVAAVAGHLLYVG